MRRLASATLVLAVVWAGATARAHKPITSPYTYNEHVFPILRDRCGRCHVEGGPTPMSLMTYKDAMPWAESIREQLTAEAMPPWYADPAGPALKGGHVISAKELDILLTWASGGAPEGTAAAPPPFAPPAGWKAGPPDVSIALDNQVLAAGALQDTREMTVASGLKQETWIRAFDLQPGTPSMVREAEIAVENGPVLGVWVPGHDATPTPGGTAFRLAAGTRLRVTVHYKKNWQDEQQEKSDRSTVGLYVTEAPVSGRAIETLTLDGVKGGMLAAPSRLIAVRPVLDRAYAALAVDAVVPATGRRVPLLRLHAPRPGWDRRYWLADPIELPKGAKIEVTTDAAIDIDGPVTPSTGAPLRLDVDLVTM